MEDCLKMVGKQIRIYRKARNMSQKELSRKAGLHYTYIGQIERGTKNATIMSLNKISQALGISLSELLTDMEKNI